MIDLEAIRVLQGASQDQKPPACWTVCWWAASGRTPSRSTSSGHSGIPLKTLIDAQLWVGVSQGPITDAEFDEMLQPWWPGQD
jgi:hypothetical protein